VRFPGRDNESLAPIFTPPRSVAEAEAEANFSHQAFEDVPVHTYTAEETKEALDVARNSMELLSTVLSSSPQQDALQVTVFCIALSQAHIITFLTAVQCAYTYADIVVCILDMDNSVYA
jgi:hypothetical protein